MKKNKSYLDFALIDENKQIKIYKKVCNRKKISISELNDAKEIGKVRLIDRIRRRFRKKNKVMLSYFSWRCYIESILKDKIVEIKKEISNNNEVKGCSFKEKSYFLRYEKYLNDKKRFTDIHIDSFPSLLMFAYGLFISVFITVASMAYSLQISNVENSDVVDESSEQNANIIIGNFYIQGLIAVIIITIIVAIALIAEKQKEKRKSSFYEDIITIVHDLADESEDT